MYTGDARETLKSDLSGQEHLDWDASVKIRLESHFKPPPNVAWIPFATIVFHVVFCCPDFLKSIWRQTGYAKKQIWAGSLNKALVFWVWILDNEKGCGDRNGQSCRNICILSAFQNNLLIKENNIFKITFVKTLQMFLQQHFYTLEFFGISFCQCGDCLRVSNVVRMTSGFLSQFWESEWSPSGENTELYRIISSLIHS